MVDISSALNDATVARHKASLSYAWVTASQVRAKRMTPLKKLLSGGKPKRPSAAELAKARAEHQALMAADEEA